MIFAHPPPMHKVGLCFQTLKVTSGLISPNAKSWVDVTRGVPDLTCKSRAVSFSLGVAFIGLHGQLQSKEKAFCNFLDDEIDGSTSFEWTGCLSVLKFQFWGFSEAAR